MVLAISWSALSLLTLRWRSEFALLVLGSCSPRGSALSEDSNNFVHPAPVSINDACRGDQVTRVS